jgi:hypothetical protein
MTVDSIAEYEALRSLIKETGLKMIQWRNFNIDPDWYLENRCNQIRENVAGCKTNAGINT